MIRASASLLALRAAGAAALFAANVAMARLHGDEAYGVFAYVASIAGLLSFMVCAGSDTYMRKRAATADARTAGALHRRLGLMQLAIALPAAVVFALTMTLSSDEAGTGSIAVMIGGYLLIIALGQQLLLSGWLIGVGRPGVDTSLTQTLQPLLVLALIVVAAAPFLGGLAVSGAGLLVCAQTAAVISVVLVMAVVLRAVRGRASRSPEPSGGGEDEDPRSWSKLFALCVPFALLSATAIVERNVDAIMIGMFRSTTETGVYYACTRISALFLLALFALNAVTSPMVARAHRAGDTRRLQYIAVRVARLSSAVAGVLLVAVLMGGERLLGLFGERYGEAYAALVVLAVGNFARTLFGPVVMIATMSDLEGPASRINTVSLAANIALNLLLIPPLGLLGAALTTATTRVVRSLVLSTLLRCRLGVRTWAFSTQGPDGGERS